MYAARQNGLTRIEIVVIALILLMGIAILVPYVLQSRVSQRRLFCEMRQIHAGFALIQYEDHEGAFPGYVNLQAVDSEGIRQSTSWVFPSLPYLHPSQVQITLDEETGKFIIQAPENAVLDPYKKTHEQFGPDGSTDRGISPSVFIKELMCPADRPPIEDTQVTRMSLVVNTGMPDAKATEEIPADWRANGVFTDQFSTDVKLARPVSLKFVQAKDGAAHTILLSENIDAGGWTDVSESLVGFTWIAAKNETPGEQLWRINQHVAKGDGSPAFARPSSYHPGGVNSIFCNGRTTFLANDIDYLVYARLLSTDSTSVMHPGTETLVDPPYLVPDESTQSK